MVIYGLLKDDEIRRDRRLCVQCDADNEHIEPHPDIFTLEGVQSTTCIGEGIKDNPANNSYDPHAKFF